MIELTILIFIPIFRNFKESTGLGRRAGGEVLKDVGIALFVSSAFKWTIIELSFWAVVVMGAILIVIGTRMKFDGK